MNIQVPAPNHRVMGYLTRDARFNDKINYSTSDMLLFDIRRYLRAVVALQVVFVTIVVITFGLVWNQVSKYDLLKPENINTINDYVVETLSNVKAMSSNGVPIASNLQYASEGLVAAIAALYNFTGVYSAALPQGGRKLLQNDTSSQGVVTQAMLADQDYRLRAMIYSQVHDMLASANEHVATFDMGNVNLILLGVGEQIQTVNLTGVATRYDRTLTDLENTAHFGILASAMLGAVAGVTNTSLPGLADATAFLKKTAIV